MANFIETAKLIFKKGLKAQFSALDQGEPGYATDTKELMIGAGGENIVVAKQTDVTALTEQTTANTEQIASVSESLAGKANTAHTHSLTDINDITAEGATNGYALIYNGSTQQFEPKPLPDGTEPGSFVQDSSTNGNIVIDGVETNVYTHPATHTISEVSGLQAALDTKASTDTATTYAKGLMSVADKAKLDGIAAEANKYVHPTGDGNSHVPATGVTNNGKVLKAGSAANSAAWGSVDWTEVTSKPSTFTPAAHTHTEVTALENKTDWVDPRDLPFGAKMDALLPDGTLNPSATDDTAAIRGAIAYAEANRKSVLLPGVFLVSGEIEIKQPIIIQGIGSGGGYSSNVLYDYKQLSGFRVVGTGTKRLRTRRNWRATSSDPNDASLSVVLNVQSENVKLRNFSVFLDFTIPDGVNPKDDSPTNYGSNFDVGIFLGCRTHFFQEDIHVLGYFREAGWWYDVTHATNLPRFKDLTGVEYDNTFNISGGDGCTMIKCFTLGAKWGIFVAGGIRKPGETVTTYKTARPDYYDYTLNTASITGSGTSGSTTLTVNTNDYFLVGDTLGITGHSGTRKIASIVGNTITLTSALNTTVTDANITIYRADYRGTFGFSDFSMFACSIYGTDHHSRTRRNAFSGDYLTDTAGGSIWIDGMAGNGSGMIQGMRFVSCRFATWEPFQVRLDQANRVQFYGCHIENRSGTDIKNPDGTTASFVVGTGVYSYITATSNTNEVLCVGCTTQTMVPGDLTNSPYISASSKVHNFFSSNETISSTTNVLKAPRFDGMPGAEMDFRSGSSTDSIRFRMGSGSRVEIGNTTVNSVSIPTFKVYSNFIPSSTSGAFDVGNDTYYWNNIVAKAFKPVAMTAGSAPNGTLFKDSTDGKLKWKNDTGVVTILA